HARIVTNGRRTRPAVARWNEVAELAPEVGEHVLARAVVVVHARSLVAEAAAVLRQPAFNRQAVRLCSLMEWPAAPVGSPPVTPIRRSRIGAHHITIGRAIAGGATERRLHRRLLTIGRRNALALSANGGGIPVRDPHHAGCFLVLGGERSRCREQQSHCQAAGPCEPNTDHGGAFLSEFPVRRLARWERIPGFQSSET